MLDCHKQTVFPVNGSNQITENRINDNDEQRNNQILGEFVVVAPVVHDDNERAEPVWLW